MLTDWGTEAGLYKVPNYLPVFIAWLAGKDTGHMTVDPKSRLLPRAIWIPGWNHIWDNNIKDYCYKFRWFPQFLNKLKGIVKIFGKRMYREAET